MNSPVIDLIFKKRLVAIIRMDDLSHAIELSRALLAGGVSVQEYTLTNPDSLRVIGQLQAAIDDFRQGTACLGLGSIRNLDEAKDALAAGTVCRDTYHGTRRDRVLSNASNPGCFRCLQSDRDSPGMDRRCQSR